MLVFAAVADPNCHRLEPQNFERVVAKYHFAVRYRLLAGAAVVAGKTIEGQMN